MPRKSAESDNFGIRPGEEQNAEILGREFLEPIRAMNRSLRGRGVVEKPRAKSRTESGGALSRDESASRLAAHHRQRRERGVGQARQKIYSLEQRSYLTQGFFQEAWIGREMSCGWRKGPVL